MNCANHPQAPARGICCKCRRPACQNCILELSGKYFCAQCVEELTGNVGDETIPGMGHTNLKVPSRLLTFALSLIPGAGYYYLGLMKRGLQAMTLFFGAIFLGSLPGMGGISSFLIPVILFYTVFDTQQLWRLKSLGSAVEDKGFINMSQGKMTNNKAAYLLITLGALALLNNTLPLYFDYNLRRILPSLIILATGIYILYLNTAGRRRNG